MMPDLAVGAQVVGTNNVAGIDVTEVDESSISIARVDSKATFSSFPLVTSMNGPSRAGSP